MNSQLVGQSTKKAITHIGLHNNVAHIPIILPLHLKNSNEKLDMQREWEIEPTNQGFLIIIILFGFFFSEIRKYNLEINTIKFWLAVQNLPLRDLCC